MKSLWKFYSNFWLRNVSVIILLLSVFTFVASVDKSDRSLTEIWEELVPSFFIVYGCILISNILLIKRYMITKRYNIFLPLFTIYWIVVLIGTGLLNMLIDGFDSWLSEILNTIFLMFLGSGTYFIHLWVFNDITVREKRLVNTVAELDFLKMQLNPHFLLNAMNNLYGEALTNPRETPERILQLSHLLRYQLEATKREFVSLDQEIEFLKEYFNYYKFRTNDLVVDIKYEGDIEKFQVPPLLYFSLVENAIKFALQTEFPFIKLRGYARDNHLLFELENSCLPDEMLQKGTGVGLLNLERRLEVSQLRYKFTKNKSKYYYKTTLELWELPTSV
ncbi:sensor histidine kinase [Myroides odoratimimus]|uniref:sensor histidine kinase n=1 Tax=Myroides odoratimimus TaxID=76832 RepID=UPI0025783D9B|nr:histidine kinase [Myroides odoratimimus]MDM1450113.1 histidine kinase [Myroides odoratimimus]